MATVLIQKRKRDKRFSHIVYYKDSYTGQRKYYKTFQRQVEAQKAANDLRTLLDSGKLPSQHKTRINPLTFEDLAEQLKKDWLNRLKTGELQQKSADEYIITLNVVKRTFNRQLLCEISLDAIKDYRSEVAFELSNISSNRRLFVIKQVFKLALAQHEATENICDQIKYLSEKKHERNRFLLPHELDDLITASKQTKAKHYMPALIYLGAEHGTSRQEALSLLWSDINFDFDDIGLIRFFRTKNQRERTEYLMPRSKKAIMEWRDHQEWMRHRKKISDNGSNLIFCHLNGTPLKQFKSAWKRICEEAEIENFHFHDLRHTFCSNLILSGAGLKEVKEMIGHSDISMTDRYSHLTPKHKLLKQQQLAEHYTDNLEKVVSA
jgi:integrase